MYLELFKDKIEISRVVVRYNPIVRISKESMHGLLKYARMFVKKRDFSIHWYFNTREHLSMKREAIEARH